jgi:hypothetical protein
MNPLTWNEQQLAERIVDSNVAEIDRTLMAMIRTWLKKANPLTDKMKRALHRIAQEQGATA